MNISPKEARDTWDRVRGDFGRYGPALRAVVSRPLAVTTSPESLQPQLPVCTFIREVGWIAGVRAWRIVETERGAILEHGED